jgi:two-component system, response regulator YesN
MSGSNDICKVLIVDDEVLIRQGIKYCMNWEQEGIRIVGEATNGREALALIESTRPHIVLTDLVMPVMDGEELTRAIKSSHPDIEVVVLSSFGEFDQVRATFQSGVADYILKPKLEPSELLKVLRATAARQRPAREPEPQEPHAITTLIDKRLNGFESEDSEEDPATEEAAARYFPYDGFHLLGVDWKPLHDAEERIRGEWIREAERLLAAELPRSVVLQAAAEPNRTLFVINAPVAERAETARAAAAVAAFIRKEAPDAILALGSPFDSLRELQHRYRSELSQLFQYGFYRPERELVAADSRPEPAAAPEMFNLNRLTDTMKRGQLDAAFEELKRHASELALSGTTDVFEYKSFLSNMVFTVTVLLGNLGYDTKELDQSRYAYFNAIDAARSAAAAAELLYAFLFEAESCAQASAGKAGGTSNIKMLIEYIEQHYAEPLTLKEMASHFHFNPSYLSSYFSAHAKEGFTDYLNKIRIDKAAELLRSHPATISEISGMVGYSDHSYFCKVFRKMTGYSPSQFRRHHANS